VYRVPVEVSQSDCGEEWADEENALTAAQAQAFKRAASCYGLGRYLYNELLYIAQFQ